jgi:hypothetical protein
MTTETNPMTDEEMRVAIAEFCGWARVRVVQDEGNWKGQIRGRRPTDTFFGDELFEVPDFLNDLNAMHEAEKVLVTRGDLGLYCAHLRRDIQEAEGIIGSCGSLMVHSTARQRAIAFLKTIQPC